MACNPGLCPDWESNLRPYRSQAGSQPSEATPARAGLLFYELVRACESRAGAHPKQRMSWGFSYLYPWCND